MSWLTTFKCALYAYTYLFVPQPNITAAQLAYICSQGGCVKEISFESQAQFDALPADIKAQFQLKEKTCVK